MTTIEVRMSLAGLKEGEARDLMAMLNDLLSLASLSNRLESSLLGATVTWLLENKLVLNWWTIGSVVEERPVRCSTNAETSSRHWADQKGFERGGLSKMSSSLSWLHQSIYNNPN